MDKLLHFITAMKKSKLELPEDIYYTIAKEMINIDDKIRLPDETEIDKCNSEIIVTLKWKRNGLLHRDCDMPAVIKSTGELIWYQNGIIERNLLYKDYCHIKIKSLEEYLLYNCGIKKRKRNGNGNNIYFEFPPRIIIKKDISSQYNLYYKSYYVEYFDKDFNKIDRLGFIDKKSENEY